MEAVVRVDEKGRILIPKDFRERLSIGKKGLVKMRIEGARLVIEPVLKVEKVRAREIKEAFFDAGEATFGE